MITDEQFRRILVIQGGMGVYISTPFLARAVSCYGKEQVALGTVSGVAAHIIFTRILQIGDPGGHYRRALNTLSDFGLRDEVGNILDKYFVEGGIKTGQSFKTIPAFTMDALRELKVLTIIASYVFIWIAKHYDNGIPHGRMISINYLEKMQLPQIYSFVGAMMAGVDCISMGAGIPIQVPGVLDSLSNSNSGEYVISVSGTNKNSPTYSMRFSWNEMFDNDGPLLKRPAFIPIISSNLLGEIFLKRASGSIQGFVVETSTAGGHNAPPRGKQTVYNNYGEPVYGERDVVDLPKLIASSKLPVWIGGSYTSTEAFKDALGKGCTGIQVGSAFALSDDSGMRPDLAMFARQMGINGNLRIKTDPKASPTGFPFKVAPIPDTLYDQMVYNARTRVCNFCGLTTLYIKEDGTIGYRCPAEDPVNYVRKLSKFEDTIGARCICNGLVSTTGYADSDEPPIVTLGDDLSFLKYLMNDNKNSYTVKDVLDYLLGYSL